MSKKQIKVQDEHQELRDELKRINAQKAVLPARSRRYKPKERELILQGVVLFGQAETMLLSGVRDWTIKVWLRRSGPPIEKDCAENYSGDHPHWQRALDVWKSQPGLGPAQISNQLKRDGIRITVSTVRSILEENGYTPPMVVSKPERILRYEAARPRELMHMDFKHFYINKQKLFLLLLQDDFSRFLAGFKLTDSENMDSVIEVFETCVARYGRMQVVMTDAGSSFYSWNGLNRFQKLISEEYAVDHIKASSPRSNGKVESVNKQIEKELLRVKDFSSLEEAKLGIEEWVQFYNFERTHMGLPQSLVPADRFLYGWNQKQEQPPPPAALKRPSLRVSSPVATAEVLPLPPVSTNTVWEEILKVALTKIK